VTGAIEVRFPSGCVEHIEDPEVITFKDIIGQEQPSRPCGMRTGGSSSARDDLRRAAGCGKATTARALGRCSFATIRRKIRRVAGAHRATFSNRTGHPDFHVITKELIRYHDKTGKSKGIDLSIT
jgi:hypothetical protein